VLQPQFSMLAKMVAGNAHPCADGTTTCLGDLQTAITAAEGAPSPPQLNVPDFVVGSKNLGTDGKHPLFGATVSTVITPPGSPAPATTTSPQYVATTSLTLSAENHLYDALTVTQTFGVGSPVSYALTVAMGEKQTNHAAYTFGPYSGSALAVNQSQTQGGTFQFCPDFNLPLAGGFVFSVSASAACDGTATVDYDVNLQPNVGYVRFTPNLDLRLRGKVTANFAVISGTGEVDAVLASLNGGEGVIYGSFNEPGYGEMFALRPFAYYNANALSVDLTISVKTFFGARLGSRTFHLYDGVVLSPLTLDKTHWSVSRIAGT